MERVTIDGTTYEIRAVESGEMSVEERIRRFVDEHPSVVEFSEDRTTYDEDVWFYCEIIDWGSSTTNIGDNITDVEKRLFGNALDITMFEEASRVHFDFYLGITIDESELPEVEDRND